VLIVIDGLDGVGKTTTAKALARRIHGRYLSWLQPPFRQIIHRLWSRGDQVAQNALNLVFLAALRHTSDVAAKDVLSGRHVVIDRYHFTATIVHPLICKVNSEVAEAVDVQSLGLLTPDWSFHLQLSDTARMQRVMERGGGKSPTEIFCDDFPWFLEGMKGGFAEYCERGVLRNVPTDGLSPRAVVDQLCAQMSLTSSVRGAR